MIVRGGFFGLLALGLLIAVAQAQSLPLQKITGRMGLSEYESAVAGRAGSDQARTIDAYMLGLLTAIERTLADERDRGRKPPFCPPARKVLSISDLHATIQVEVKDDPTYRNPASRVSLGYIAATGYVRRYPCLVGASQQPGDAPVQAEKLTVKEFEKLFEQLKPALNSARVTLTDFSLGFRDGIEGMQVHTSASQYDICFPEPGFDASSSVLLAIKEELRLRRDYWADKQDWSVGPAAMAALKRRNPCKR